MKVAVLSESPADEAAIRILVDGILGRQTQTVGLPDLRTRGWPSTLQFLPGVLKHLYYRTDAEALVVDSDSSPAHGNTHDQPGRADPQCRLCQLRKVAAQTQSQLRPVAGRLLLKTAIGLAVPTIEAWYCCGVDLHATEAVWTGARQSKAYPHTANDLKRKVYGTDRPSLELEKQRAKEEARRLVQNPSLESKGYSQTALERLPKMGAAGR